MTNDTITMTRAEFDHRLKMAREDGYQEGLYDGIIHACTNASKPASKRTVAQALVKNGEVVAAAVDAAVYDETLFNFIQWRNQ